MPIALLGKQKGIGVVDYKVCKYCKHSNIVKGDYFCTRDGLFIFSIYDIIDGQFENDFKNNVNKYIVDQFIATLNYELDISKETKAIFEKILFSHLFATVYWTIINYKARLEIVKPDSTNCSHYE